MATLSIKIVDVDQQTDSILVKAASEFSQKSIDEYEALSFSMSNYNVSTPESFIEIIKPALINHVKHRDYLETNPVKVNTTSWVGYTTDLTVSKNQIQVNLEAPAAVLPEQMTPSMINPEVVI